MMSETTDETEISSSTSSSSKEPVIVPTDNDVLCGRGGGILAHPGNIFYRSLVDGKKREYLSSRFKREKRSIAVNIVKEIQNLNPPGRFIAKDDTHAEWHDIGAIKAHEKTLQALREDAPQVRKKIQEEEAAELEKARKRMMQEEDDARRNAQARAIADREMRERGYWSRPPPPPPPQPPCAYPPPSNSPTCVACAFAACSCTSSPSYAHSAHQMPTLPVSYPHNVYIPPSNHYTNAKEGNEDIGRSAIPQHAYPFLCHRGLPHYYVAAHQQPPSHLPPLPRPPPPRPPQVQVDYKLHRKGNTVIKGKKYKHVANQHKGGSYHNV